MINPCTIKNKEVVNCLEPINHNIFMTTVEITNHYALDFKNMNHKSYLPL